jgi:hypothetical protein
MLPLRTLTPLALLLAMPGSARAYLIDANDARVAPVGALEIELQPIGALAIVEGGEGTQIVAPSAQLYFGLTPDLDLLVLTRGFIALDVDPLGDSPSTQARLDDQQVALRHLLRNGAYSDEGEEGDADGPAIVLQYGLLLPSFGGDAPRFGASLALLVSQTLGRGGSVHGNVWGNVTQRGSGELFLAAYAEGPEDWVLRPTVELWFDYDTEEGSLLSGLLGVLWDLTEDCLLQAGVRVGGWEGYLEIEARLSTYFGFDLFPAAPRAGGGLTSGAGASRAAAPAPGSRSPAR